MRTGDTQLWHEEGKLVSEPVFVAAPDASREEEGVVLTTLLDKVGHRVRARGGAIVKLRYLALRQNRGGKRSSRLITRH